MEKLFWVMALVGLIIMPASRPAWAQSQADQPIAFGEVKNLSASQVTITAYNDDTDENYDTVFTLTPQTTFEAVESWKDLKAGDWIEVTYQMVQDRHVALHIKKDPGEGTQ